MFTLAFSDLSSASSPSLFMSPPSVMPEFEDSDAFHCMLSGSECGPFDDNAAIDSCEVSSSSAKMTALESSASESGFEFSDDDELALSELLNLRVLPDECFELSCSQNDKN